MSQPEPFGNLPDGRPVSALSLRAPDGLAVELLDYGAIVRRLEVPSAAGPRDVVLGFDSLRPYVDDRSYQGCIVGRCANRIRMGRFAIDGTAYRLPANEGLNTLHGGAVGFGRRLWSWRETEETRAVLHYSSPDGEEGFPGAVEATVAFALLGTDALEIVYEATTDRPTPINLTHHLYFNLTGEPGSTILDHDLGVDGMAITPVRVDLIPTGQLLKVGETPFDFTRPRRIGDALSVPDPQLDLAGGIDHNWSLTPNAQPALTLSSPKSGVTLWMTTDQPGLQIYTGQGLMGPFGAHGGLAVEPQGFPDAVNRPEFPSVIVRPGETYRRRTVYRFPR